MLSLKGKVALITGASRGLGRAIALCLGEAGADVVVTDLLVENEMMDQDKIAEYGTLAAHFNGTDAVRTKQTAAEIEKLGVRSLGLKMDVTQPDQIQAAVGESLKQLGKIDILVNNAGVMDNMAVMEKQTLKMFERDLKINLTGSFNCIHTVWPHMKEQKWGRIVNISSFVGLSGALAQPGYGASKAGIVGLTRSLALEGAGHGITVNAILPGFIETEAVKMHNPKMLDQIRERIPVKRMGNPDEIAPLVAFLGSDHSSYMTGTAIPVAGGADLFSF